MSDYKPTTHYFKEDDRELGDFESIIPEEKPVDMEKEFANVDPPPLNGRRNIRIRVMQALFAQIASGIEPSVMFNNLLREAHQELRKKFLVDPTKEDDSAYVSTMYFDVLKNKEQYDTYIREKIENWEVERIAITDRILIWMGIHELINLPEIPVKVSINEYVEISKLYSSNKSSQFINGILDAILNEFNHKNLVKKRGKGLLEGKSDELKS